MSIDNERRFAIQISNKDPHNELAKRLYGEVTTENRRKAKKLNFYYLYAASPEELKQHFERLNYENK